MPEKWSSIAFLLRCHIMRCTAGYRGCRPGELSNQCQPDILLLPSLFSLLSPSLVFSLFTSPSLFSQSFFFIQLPLFLCLRFLPLTLFLFVSYLGSNFHSPFLSLALSAGKGECRRSFSNWQYTGNCFLVTVT